MRKAMKFIVRDTAHSHAIQEALFANGCRWASGGARLQYTDKPYLYVDGGIITYGASDQEFQYHPARTTELKVECKFNDVPTVELRGRIYTISEVEAALAKAKKGVDE